jgi:glycosyltransferase involved in cell wall biosynthesis
MRLAVITPYYKESIDLIRRCYDSVRAQSFQDVLHVFVSDGVPNEAVEALPGVVHIRLPNHADYGDTPRMVGAAHAANRGYDGIAFLDADNWYEPDHLERLLRLAVERKAAVATATRKLWTEDGRLLGVCPECDGVTHVDTNCFLILSPAYDVLGAWGFKSAANTELGMSGDRIFWRKIKSSGLTCAHCTVPTVNYTTTFAAHYVLCGELPPADARVFVRLPDGTATQITFEQWRRATETT